MVVDQIAHLIIGTLGLLALGLLLSITLASLLDTFRDPWK